MQRKNTTQQHNSVDDSVLQRVTAPTLKNMSALTITHVQERIRICRISRGWSLADFEIKAGGSITAVAMGSYERGERTLSIPKLMKICEVFQISPLHLLAPTTNLELSPAPGRHIYDLRALHALDPTPQQQLLLPYIHDIIKERGDWLGAVISLRASDIENLSRLFAASLEIKGSYLGWLEEQEITLERKAGFD